MTTLLTFATEDFVTPEHDLAILRLSALLTRRGIVGGFHLTGDYARHLRDRRKTEVVRALQPHEIGYHSNTHGAFPFVGSVCESRPWDEAVAELASTEAAGIADVRDLFDRSPAYYVTEFVKAPQLIVAARRAGLDTIGFSLVPGGGSPFAWLAGSLCYTGPIQGIESPPASGRLEAHKAAFDTLHAAARDGAAQGVLKLFNHPYKFIYNNNIASWCGDNDLYNGYAVQKSWRIPVRSFYDPATREDLFRQFEAFLDHTLAKGDVHYTSTGVLSRLYAANPPKTLALDAVVAATARALETWNYVRTGDGPLSLAEVFGLAVACLREVREAGALPGRAPWRRILGPVETAPAADGVGFASEAGAFLEAVAALDRDLSFFQRMPARVWIAGRSVPVAAVCKAALAALQRIVAEGRLSGPVAIEDAPDVPAIAREAYFSETEWTRPIYPPGFTGQGICAQCRLQSWSYKPAVGGR